MSHLVPHPGPTEMGETGPGPSLGQGWGLGCSLPGTPAIAPIHWGGLCRLGAGNAQGPRRKLAGAAPPSTMGTGSPSDLGLGTPDPCPDRAVCRAMKASEAASERDRPR